MINIALLGCGRIGQVHARSLMGLEGAQVAAVADAMPEAANALAVRTGAKVMEVEDVLASSDIDAVVIGTPTTTHYDLIHGAARAGKAIFCEKPIDLNAGRIRDCLAVVEQHGVPFFIAFNRRFDPNFRALKSQIDAGRIGKVEMVTILSRDPSPPPIGYIKTSGGLFRDMMIHDLDMARFLLGEDPVEVFAHGSCLVDPAIGQAGDVDTAMVSLRTGSGKLCQISNSRRATYGYDQRIEVHGSAGMLRADNVLTSTVEVSDAGGFTRAPTEPFFLERYAAAYTAEMQHFVEVLTAGTPPNPSGIDGLKAQVMADAAQASYEAGAPQALDFS
ncbi:inositol 2-dehydrogenase [Tateyamaria omphalii]|uniref:Inositol 2-dehydrogenase n=1 Tax=Tateyamaria omphalii TaxID=299262 RepID=A0A1P8MRT0_9RHOB|nr:inositol 2-dehydrogenase [Tateyamaria omphalii]APX10761.1 inositol 2-dehydrogenase [Tateyamaria omphalii]